MIRFRMADIKVNQFAILADKPPVEDVTYTVNFRFGSAVGAKRLACVFTVEFTHYEKPLIKLEITCGFDLHPEDWSRCMNVKENILTVSKENLGVLANQTVGTARGIMFCKTENSDFRNFILPPVDLSKFLEEDMVIDLNNLE